MIKTLRRHKLTTRGPVVLRVQPGPYEAALA